MNFKQFYAEIIEWTSDKQFIPLQQIGLKILLILLVAIFIAYKIKRRYRRKPRWYNKYPFVVYDRARENLSRPDLSNPDIAIKYVQESQYSVRPIMNKSAYPVFKITEQYFKDINQGHRVIPELCMGAALVCLNNEGFSSINSKRLDIGVIDRAGNLILAMEYNGSGHYQGNASGRDAVKRLALNKAKVPLIEIIPDDDESRIIEKLRIQLAL